MTVIRKTTGFVLALKDVTGPARLDAERSRRQAEMLRHLRGPVASIRSLSENVLDDRPAVTGTARRLLEALHAEALRLSRMITEAASASPVGLAGAPRHFEALTVGGLVAMTLRRVGADAGVLVETGGASAVPLRVEASTLTGALAHLLRAALGCRRPGTPVRLRPRRHGGVLQIDVGAEGEAAPLRAGTADDGQTLDRHGSFPLSRDPAPRNAGRRGFPSPAWTGTVSRRWTWPR